MELVKKDESGQLFKIFVSSERQFVSFYKVHRTSKFIEWRLQLTADVVTMR
jgi:hypothetical protein